ncbi:hypothetical protein D039_0742A, partial [Vibrio parahaemolyticus EKP-028]
MAKIFTKTFLIRA